MTKVSCRKCILNSEDDPNLTLDERGWCDYCRKYETISKKYDDPEKNKKYIQSKIIEIKHRGKKKEYDSVLGLSGGVDSSYMAYWARENGLRPLIIHFDNGWNSELAVNNIENICNILNYNLHTIVIDWEEFRELQLAYFRSGVIDIECATDHAIIATLYNMAFKYGIHYILSGVNYQTECIMPNSWNFNKQDYRNLKHINSKFGINKRFVSYPTKPIYKQVFFRHFYKIEFIDFLNHMDYKKEAAKNLLKEKFSWRDYGGKHFESVFTKLYQSYILPVKFGVDKRRAHLANLINSNQLSREEALVELSNNYYNQDLIEEDIGFLIKKWKISRSEFDNIINDKPRFHSDFSSDSDYYKVYSKILNLLKKTH